MFVKRFAFYGFAGLLLERAGECRLENSSSLQREDVLSLQWEWNSLKSRCAIFGFPAARSGEPATPRAGCSAFHSNVKNASRFHSKNKRKKRIRLLKIGIDIFSLNFLPNFTDADNKQVNSAHH